MTPLVMGEESSPSKPDFHAITEMEDEALKIEANLRSSLCKVCRDGSSAFNTGTLISKDGYVLTAEIFNPSEDNLPYFIVLDNGKRISAKTVYEPNKGVLLLKVELPENSDLVPASFTAVEETKLPMGSWHLYASWSPSPIEDEVARLSFARILREGAKSSSLFTIDAATTSRGAPLFDLNGNLVAIIGRSIKGKIVSSCIPVTKIYKEWDIFKELVDQTDTADAYQPVDADIAVLPTSRKGETYRKDLADYLNIEFTNSSLVAIFEDTKPLIFGTVISKDGMILSKASELGSDLTCTVNGKYYPATLLATDEETDLAILKIDATDLVPIEWSDRPLSSGTWLYSGVPDTTNNLDAASMGSISHLASVPRNHRSIDSPEDYTGIGVVIEHSSNACTIAAILPNSPIEKTEAQRLDTITHIDGKEVADRRALTKILATHKSGDKVKLTLKREDTIIHVEVSLTESFPNTSQANSTYSYVLSPSARAYGFKKIIIHDSPVEYWQCGGPIHNLKGEALGMNIARHSRGLTYALPVEVIRDAVTRMLSKSLKF